MTPEQFDKAEKLQKQINNHKGIFNMLHDATNANSTATVEIKFAGATCKVPERLIHEFKHAVQHSLNKLETEFNEI